jgi:hypothetical protein
MAQSFSSRSLERKSSDLPAAVNASQTQPNSLLQSDLVTLLKGYRNDTFHFKENGFHPERAQKFLDVSNSMRWVEEVTNAFDDYFRQYFETVYSQFPQLPRC